MTASITQRIEVGDVVRHAGYIRTVAGVLAGTLDLVDSEGHLVATVGEHQVTPLTTITIPAKECCGELLGEWCDCQRAQRIEHEATSAPTIIISW